MPCAADQDAAGLVHEVFHYADFVGDLCASQYQDERTFRFLTHGGEHVDLFSKESAEKDGRIPMIALVDASALCEALNASITKTSKGAASFSANDMSFPAPPQKTQILKKKQLRRFRSVYS